MAAPQLTGSKLHCFSPTFAREPQLCLDDFTRAALGMGLSLSEDQVAASSLALRHLTPAEPTSPHFVCVPTLSSSLFLGLMTQCNGR